MSSYKHKGRALANLNALDLSGGVQTKTVAALSQDNQVLHCLNGVFDTKVGAIVGRHGTVLKNDLGQKIDSMLIYRNGVARRYCVITEGNTHQEIRSFGNSGFTGSGTVVLNNHFQKGDSIHSTTFAKKEMFFNGVNAPRQWNGSAFSAIANAPDTGKFPAVYQQRLYVFSTDGFLHYSDVINATGDGFTTDEWSNRGINPNDGQACKGMVRHRSRLVLFKEESIYRFDGSNEPEPIINIGTHSEKGFVQTDTSLFFHHPSGIYQMGLGDPVVISRAVEKYLEGMNHSNWSKVVAGKDNSNIYFWIGDVTIKNPVEWDYNQSYENVVLVYNFELQRWSVWTGWQISAFLRNIDNGEQFFGTEDGEIFQIDRMVFNDNGDKIDFQIMWHPFSYGVPYLSKTISDIYLDSKGDLLLSAGKSYEQMDAKSQRRAESNPIGLIHIRKQIDFYKLWVMVSGTYSQSPPMVEQLSIGQCYVRNR